MLVIKNAKKIFTAAGENFENADILIENGKIKQIGCDIDAPPSAEIIDASELYVLPGFVDAHSHIGGFGDNGKDQDVNEMTKPATPEMDAIYAIDVNTRDFKKVLESGITTSAILPGSGNVIGGLVCAVKSHGTNIHDMCIKTPIALKMALGGNPKGVYGTQGKLPMTRMGIAQIIREHYIKAKEYAAKKKEAGDDQSKMPPYDAGLENICKVLNREIPMKVHCEQFDMLTTIRIADEFDVDFTLDHAWGSSDFYDEISGAKNLKGVIFGPSGIGLLPGEIGKIDIDCLIELDRRGVCCSLMTDCAFLHPDMMILQAGELTRFGLELDKVIAMLTINPAKIMGVEDRVGSIEVGKDADFAIFKGLPAVDTNAQAVYTVVDGNIAFMR